jgi:hypothetical protein
MSVSHLNAVPVRGQAEADVARDREECEAKALAEAPTGLGEFLAGSALRVTRGHEARVQALATGFRRCMRERGYSIEP